MSRDCVSRKRPLAVALPSLQDGNQPTDSDLVPVIVPKRQKQDAVPTSEVAPAGASVKATPQAPYPTNSGELMRTAHAKRDWKASRPVEESAQRQLTNTSNSGRIQPVFRQCDLPPPSILQSGADFQEFLKQREEQKKRLVRAAASSSETRLLHKNLANGETIGLYRIIGAGREGRAIHALSNIIFKAQRLTKKEGENVRRVVARINEAERYYPGIDIAEMKECVFPRNAEMLQQPNGTYIMFTPSEEETLHSFASDRGDNISEADVKQVFDQLLRILNFCHSIGIMVRDMKPRKLVFDSKERRLRLGNIYDCVVCDSPQDDMLTERFLSPAYVPPEVLNPKQKGYSGRAADMWGAGVLLYLLLLGQYPFFDTSPAGVFSRIRRAKVVFPNSHLSVTARSLVNMLLRRLPEERAAAKAFLHVPYWDAPSPLPCRVAKLDFRTPGAFSLVFPMLRHRVAVMAKQLAKREERDAEEHVVPDMAVSRIFFSRSSSVYSPLPPQLSRYMLSSRENDAVNLSLPLHFATSRRPPAPGFEEPEHSRLQSQAVPTLD
ncbi:unnamed protein product [Caenorhabditis auriculariae]|uniref:Protein kinase domain-containing protein n=1 Tax=Caenorhabditis auriculariae TaxID=2777116 RepID=A0A8S1GYJ1_9PELO|nr:unnamed protein product [Caenorhabditis auriculariae]